MTAGLLHDVWFSSLAAACRAKDAKAETAQISVNIRNLSSRIDVTKFMFKERDHPQDVGARVYQSIFATASSTCDGMISSIGSVSLQD